MKWLTDFWKRYRQYGSVKIAMLLFLVSLYFLVQSILAIVGYAKSAGQPMEYIISVSNPEGVQKSDISKLENLADVICISPQKLYSITCKNGTEEQFLCITELQADYLNNAYGISGGTSGKCFYLNKSAWEKIVSDPTEKSVHKTYQLDGASDESAQFIRRDDFGKIEPTAYAIGNTVSLTGSTTMRVMCAKTDISGKTLDDIRMLGYMVENELEIQSGVHELEIVMLKLKYGIVIVILSFLLGCVLIKKR